MVGRDFHHEGGSFTRKGDLLQEEARDDSSHDTDDVEREHQVLTIGREEGGSEQNVNRQTSTAAHERGHHDRDDTVRGTVHRTASHNRRNVTTETNDQRHESLTRQAQGAHNTVHHERSTSHVARVFQHRQEEVEEEDHRNKGGDSLNTAPDTVSQEHAEPIRCTNRFEQFA